MGCSRRFALRLAAVVTAAAALSSVRAPSVPPRRQTFASKEREDGFPVEFDRVAFEAYLDRRPGTVARRAAAFAAEAGPLQLRCQTGRPASG